MEELKGAVVRERNFWWYFRLQAVSTFFNNIHTLALPLWYYEITGSRFESALIFAISGLISIVTLPFIGAVIDRHSNRTLLVALELVRAAAIGILAYSSASPSFLMVTIVASASSVCSTIFASLQQAIMKRNITAENSARAQSLLSSIQGASLVIAPSVGALLIGAFGYQLVFMLNAGSFLFGIASALFVASNQVSLIPRQSFWTDTKSGIKLIIENAKLQPLLILSVTNAAATGALGILYIQHFTNAGFDIQAIALFMASQGIGVFVGSRYFTNSTLAKSINPAFFSLLSGASLVGVSQLASFHQVAVMVVLIIAGITAVLLGISLRTLVQNYSKVENIGRITSLISLGSVIGSFASLAFVTTTSVYLQPSVQLLFLGFLQVSVSLALLYFKRS